MKRRTTVAFAHSLLFRGRVWMGRKGEDGVR